MTVGPARRHSLGELIFTAILWLVALGVFVGAFGFRYPANVAPLLLGGSAFVLLSWLLLPSLYAAWRGRATPAAPAAASAPATDGEPAGPALTAERHEPAALAWTVATIGLLVVFGFLAGVTVALLGLFRIHGRESWPMSIIATAAVMATLYVAFGIVLRVPFFPGLLIEWLR